MKAAQAAPTHAAMTHDLLERIERVIDDAKADLAEALKPRPEPLELSGTASLKICVAHAYEALRVARGGHGFTPAERTKITSAYRLCAAAIGRDE